MKAIFFVSFCVAMLMVNFVNAQDKPKSPVGDIGYKTITNVFYPGKICTCMVHCVDRDAVAVMAKIKLCEERGACKSGGDCLCGDHRCLWKYGENHETFTVKVPEYPMYECQCSKRGCRRREAQNILRTMASVPYGNYGGTVPCKRNGLCHCKRFEGRDGYAYPVEGRLV